MGGGGRHGPVQKDARKEFVGGDGVREELGDVREELRAPKAESLSRRVPRRKSVGGDDVRGGLRATRRGTALSAKPWGRKVPRWGREGGKGDSGLTYQEENAPPPRYR